MFLQTFDRLLDDGWADAFAQERTLARAKQQAVGMACCFGRRTISRAICALGRQHQDWSADYKLFSRSRWDPERLFAAVVSEYLERYPGGGPITVAFDDTKLKKSGRKIKDGRWQRDPMSPPFHANLVWGLRIAHAALIFPHYREGEFGARAFPISFRDAPALKKPGKRASDQQRAEYKELKKTHNLSRQFLAQMKDVRARLDEHGAEKRTMIAAVDGSFCNKTIFAAKLDRVEIVARCRKDAALCFPAPAGSRRVYGTDKFRPEEVRVDDEVPWKETRIYFGGGWRVIRYKDLNGVLWQRGGGRRRLRLLVVAAQPYRRSARAKVNYRQPAYLLGADLESPAQLLIQAYFDRWQIEVNHREMKQVMGVGEAQVWSDESVPRHPAFAAAVYSMLLLAGLKAYGPGRTDDYLPLPKWRRNAKRASALDLVTLLRREVNETRDSSYTELNIPRNTVMYAYG